MHGLQLWAALPQAHEEAEPCFSHTPAAAIPEFAVGGAQIRLLIGSVPGHASPVPTLETVLLDDRAKEMGRLVSRVILWRSSVAIL